MNQYAIVFSSKPIIIGLCFVVGIVIGFFTMVMIKRKRNKGFANDSTTKKQAETPKTQQYECVCGFKTDTRIAFAGHLRSKGQHAAKVAEMPTITQEKKTIGKYPAMAFTANGITYIKIDKPMGRPIYLDPSIPGHHGSHYLVHEIPGGYEAYDPREKPFDASETPSRCYKATHVYDLIRALFANKYGLLDKINYIIMGLLIVCCFFIVLTLIDKVGR